MGPLTCNILLLLPEPILMSIITKVCMALEPPGLFTPKYFRSLPVWYLLIHIFLNMWLPHHHLLPLNRMRLQPPLPRRLSCLLRYNRNRLPRVINHLSTILIPCIKIHT